MNYDRHLKLTLLALAGLVLPLHHAAAAVKLGTGNSSLLGGDLTDPTDSVKEKPGMDFGQGLPEEQMRPEGGAWISMKLTPTSSPYQSHAYQSWQGSPACRLFMNNPESGKWYMGFKDGGNGGPTRLAPYSVTVQLKDPVVLTHFTMTTDKSEPIMPNRDPMVWSVQGSNTGKDDDWTDIYKCEADSRTTSPFKVSDRNVTTLFTSFYTKSPEGRVDPVDLKKLEAKLQGKKGAKPDFELPKKAFSWYRLVIYSCFNASSSNYRDFNRPPGCALAQMELFGVADGFKFAELKEPPGPDLSKGPLLSSLKPAVSDVPFMISYWCGPPRSETTVERYKEIAECGFNVAFPAIDTLWSPYDKAAEEHNAKYLEVCKEAGLKALVWDGSIPKGKEWEKPTAEEIPEIEKSLDGILARYASQPAYLGLVLGDEMLTPAHPRLGVINQYLLKKNPKSLPYYNLLPLYAFTNKEAEYQAMVQDYIDTVKPALVSWDHYRQMFGGGDESTYWKNLELMRKKCTEAGVPFNQIIVSLKHMGYRECSEADLRWQVYTSLAFGSRGIQYFTYWYTHGLAWADAPSFISKEGKRDRKYDYAKKINNRIAKLGPTLVKLVCTGAYCNDPMPPGGISLEDNSPLKNIDGGRVVVGCFQDAEGKRYIFPVNRTLRYVVTSRLTLDEWSESVSEVSQETGELLPPTPLTDGLLTLKLQPGDGQLFLINEKPKAK